MRDSEEEKRGEEKGMRIVKRKAEIEMRELPKFDASLYELLSQDDALRLAKETAVKSQEVDPAVLRDLYEKVVLDEITIPQYMRAIRNSVKGPAYSNVLLEIERNLGKFV